MARNGARGMVMVRVRVRLWVRIRTHSMKTVLGVVQSVLGGP